MTPSTMPSIHASSPSPSVPSVLSVDALTLAIATGQVWPGDCILYRYAKPDMTQRMIARTQARALNDLTAKTQSTPCGNSSCLGDHGDMAVSAFTHAGMVVGCSGSVEMTSPRCRYIDWPERLDGIAEVVIVRPAGDVTRAQLVSAARWALAESRRGTRYPYREILLYWLWSWGFRKLRGKTPFAKVFRSRTRNVCSGSVIQWWQQAGSFLQLGDGTDSWPEAWYPARLLADPRFRVVAHFSVATNDTNSTKKTKATEDRNTHVTTAHGRVLVAPLATTPHSGSVVLPSLSPSCCSCRSWLPLSSLSLPAGCSAPPPLLLLSSSPPHTARRQGSPIPSGMMDGWNPGIPSFHHSTIPLFHHSSIPPFHPRSPRSLTMRRLPFCLLASALCLLLLTTGCRYAEVGSIRVKMPKEAVDNQLHSLTINQTLYTGDIEIGQGKSVPVKALSDLAASAAQTGNPTTNLDDSSKQEPAPVEKPAAPSTGSGSATTDNGQPTTDTPAN